MKEKIRKVFLNTNSILVLVLFVAGLGYALLSGNDPFVMPYLTNPINFTYMMLVAFFQNISFSMVSRARNRDSVVYHMVAAWFSNGVWFATFAYLVHFGMSWALFIPYTCGTVAGSLTGARISMWIEGLLGATSDSHIKKVPTRIEIKDRVSGEIYAIEVVRGFLNTKPYLVSEIERLERSQSKTA